MVDAHTTGPGPNRAPGVVFIHPGGELYGSDRMVLESVRATIAGGFRTTLLLSKDGPLANLAREIGASVDVVPTPVARKGDARILGLVRFGANVIYAVPRIIRALRISGPDTVVWANTLTQPHWIIISWLMRRPLVVHVREEESEAKGIVRKALVAPLALAQVVIANSNATRDFIVGNMPSRVESHIRVIYNGKDWAPYFRHSPRRKAGRLQVLLVGRISPRKGQDIALEALLLLRRRGIDARLTIVGDVFPGYEWYRAELNNFIHDNKLQSVCHFAGFVCDPTEYFAGADVVVVPSRIEPFGTVAVEALAAMRPTVVSGTGGLPEVVMHGETGLVVESGNPQELAEALYQLYVDPEFSLRLATNGHHNIRKRFSMSEYEKGINSVMHHIQEMRR